MALHVNLTPELERYVREKIRQGYYGTASEVLREALRLLIERDREHEIRIRALAVGRPADPSGASDASQAARLRDELALIRSGEALMEQNLRRQDPGASDAEIGQRMDAWRCQPDPGDEAPGFLVRAPARLARLLRGRDR